MADLKIRLTQLLDLSHSFQRQLIAELDPGERHTNGTWEDWSLKDELAHVIAWQLNSLARIAASIHAEPVPDSATKRRSIGLSTAPITSAA